MLCFVALILLLLLLCFATFILVPYCFHFCTLLCVPYYFHSRLCCLAFVTLLFTLGCSCLVVHALLFALPCFCCLVVHVWLLTPCCFALLVDGLVTLPSLSCHHTSLVDGPCYPAIVFWCSTLLIIGCSSLLFAFFKHLLGSPHFCFTALLLIVVPCCFALSIGTPSPFSYASGGAWSNTNKLHPPIYIYIYIYVLYFVCHFF